MNFGKFRGLTFKEVVLREKQHMDWANKEDVSKAHPHFKKMIVLHRLYFRYYPTAKVEEKIPTAASSSKGNPWPQEPEFESGKTSKPPAKFDIHTDPEEISDIDQMDTAPSAIREKKQCQKKVTEESSDSWTETATIAKARVTKRK